MMNEWSCDTLTGMTLIMRSTHPIKHLKVQFIWTQSVHWLLRNVWTAQFALYNSKNKEKFRLSSFVLKIKKKKKTTGKAAEIIQLFFIISLIAVQK